MPTRKTPDRPPTPRTPVRPLRLGLLGGVLLLGGLSLSACDQPTLAVKPVQPPVTVPVVTVPVVVVPVVVVPPVVVPPTEPPVTPPKGTPPEPPIVTPPIVVPPVVTPPVVVPPPPLPPPPPVVEPPPPPPPVTKPLAAPSLTPSSLVFSGIKSATSSPQAVMLSRPLTLDTRDGPLTVTALSVTGPDAAAFVVEAVPHLPLTLQASSALPTAVKFVPAGKVGVLRATLHLELQGEAALDVQLAGLSALALEGEFEPALDAIVRTLGYGTQVGTPNLILGTTAPLMGQERSAPLFRKSGTGPVTLKPVGRYSPTGPLPYGFFTLNTGATPAAPVLHPLATVAAAQYQTLNPALESGSLTFDPGSETFGVYTGQTAYSVTNDYTLDALNTGPTRHAVRVYPLVDGTGLALPGYLLALEASSNGDYQDAVFVLTGAEAVVGTP